MPSAAVTTSNSSSNLQNQQRSASTSTTSFEDSEFGSIMRTSTLHSLSTSPCSLSSASYDSDVHQNAHDKADHDNGNHQPMKIVAGFPVFPLCRAGLLKGPASGQFSGGLTSGQPLVKKRRSSSSPEDGACRSEKWPHLAKDSSPTKSNSSTDDLVPTTSSGSTSALASILSLRNRRDAATTPSTPSTSSSSPFQSLANLKSIVSRSNEKDVNLTAELFWLKTQLSDHWSMKWMWQVHSYELIDFFCHLFISGTFLFD